MCKSCASLLSGWGINFPPVQQNLCNTQIKNQIWDRGLLLLLKITVAATQQKEKEKEEGEEGKEEEKEEEGTTVSSSPPNSQHIALICCLLPQIIYNNNSEGFASEGFNFVWEKFLIINKYKKGWTENILIL